MWLASAIWAGKGLTASIGVPWGILEMACNMNAVAMEHAGFNFNPWEHLVYVATNGVGTHASNVPLPKSVPMAQPLTLIAKLANVGTLGLGSIAQHVV